MGLLCVGLTDLTYSHGKIRAWVFRSRSHVFSSREFSHLQQCAAIFYVHVLLGLVVRGFDIVNFQDLVPALTRILT